MHFTIGYELKQQRYKMSCQLKMCSFASTFTVLAWCLLRWWRFVFVIVLLHVRMESSERKKERKKNAVSFVLIFSLERRQRLEGRNNGKIGIAWILCSVSFFTRLFFLFLLFSQSLSNVLLPNMNTEICLEQWQMATNVKKKRTYADGKKRHCRGVGVRSTNNARISCSTSTDSFIANQPKAKKKNVAKNSMPTWMGNSPKVK